MLFYIGSVLLSKSGLFHNQVRRDIENIYVWQHGSVNPLHEKKFFRAATSLHDFAEIMLLCLQCWILNSLTFEWKSNKCFSTYTTSYALAARIFLPNVSGVGLLAQTGKAKWGLRFRKKERRSFSSTLSVLLFLSSLLCNYSSVKTPRFSRTLVPWI